jgi:hypothetical protein
VRSFSTNSRPACGRPPAAAVLAPAATRRPPGHRRHPPPQVIRARPPEEGRSVSDSRTVRRLVALPPGRLADLLVAIPARLTLILEPVLATPTTRTPHPPKHRPDPLQHGLPTSLPAPTLTLTRYKHKEQQRSTEPARHRGATSGPHRSRASRTTPVMKGRPTSQLSSSLLSTSLVAGPPRLSLTRKGSQVQTLSRPPGKPAGQAGSQDPASCFRDLAPGRRAANGQQPRANRRVDRFGLRPDRGSTRWSARRRCRPARESGAIRRRARPPGPRGAPPRLPPAPGRRR